MKIETGWVEKAYERWREAGVIRWDPGGTSEEYENFGYVGEAGQGITWPYDDKNMALTYKERDGGLFSLIKSGSEEAMVVNHDNEGWLEEIEINLVKFLDTVEGERHDKLVELMDKLGRDYKIIYDNYSGSLSFELMLDQKPVALLVEEEVGGEMEIFRLEMGNWGDLLVKVWKDCAGVWLAFEDEGSDEEDWVIGFSGQIDIDSFDMIEGPWGADKFFSGLFIYDDRSVGV